MPISAYDKALPSKNGKVWGKGGGEFAKLNHSDRDQSIPFVNEHASMILMWKRDENNGVHWMNENLADRKILSSVTGSCSAKCLSFLAPRARNNLFQNSGPKRCSMPASRLPTVHELLWAHLRALDAFKDAQGRDPSRGSPLVNPLTKKHLSVERAPLLVNYFSKLLLHLRETSVPS